MRPLHGLQPQRRSYAAAVSQVFDVLTYDMMFMIRLPFTPGGALCWCYRNDDAKQSLAVADKDTGRVLVYDVASGSNTPVLTVECHRAPVCALRYNIRYNTVVSADRRGVIEYWRPADGSFPSEDVDFTMKLETNLFDMAKARRRRRQPGLAWGLGRAAGYSKGFDAGGVSGQEDCTGR